MAAAAAAIPQQAVPAARALLGADRAAALLLAMGKQAAGRLLKRFDSAELKEIARAASALGTISPGELEFLVDEFSQEFSEGVSLMGTAAEVEKLLTGILTNDQVSDIMSDVMGQTPAATSGVWDRVSQAPEGPLADFLANEHPQTAALILSKMRPETAAKTLGKMPTTLRNGLMRRMAALKPVTPAALKAIESEMHEALITQLERSPASEAYLRMADILNRMDPAQCDEVLTAIEDGRPEVAKALRAMMFRFEDLVKLDAKGCAVVFDQVSAEHVVLALRGVEGPLVEIVLSSIASRTRRMVEHELQNPGDVDQRAVADARRRIADRAMSLLSKGEIALNASENAEA